MALPINTARAARMLTVTFNTSAQILRKSTVRDTSGGTIDSYATVATKACTFTRSNVTPRERENAFTIQHISYWTFVFEAGTDIRNTDRLYVAAEGRTFEVVGGRSGSLELATRVVCVELI